MWGYDWLVGKNSWAVREVKSGWRLAGMQLFWLMKNYPDGGKIFLWGMGWGGGVFHMWQEQRNSWLHLWGPVRHKDIKAALGSLGLIIHILRQLEVICDVLVILNAKITPNGGYIFPTRVSCLKTFQNRSKSLKSRSELLQAFFQDWHNCTRHSTYL